MKPIESTRKEEDMPNLKDEDVQKAAKKIQLAFRSKRSLNATSKPKTDTTKYIACYDK